MVIVGGEARRSANGAVDVERVATTTTDEVMMIIADPILIPRGRSARLNSTDEILVGQHAEAVVHGLARDGTDNGTDVVRELIGSGMGASRDGLHDGQALGGHVHPRLAQKSFEILYFFHAR